MQSSTYPKLELKYCERCGSLWLRPRGGQAVYCARCEDAIAELPPVRPRGQGPIGAVQAACVAVLAAFATLLTLTDQIGAIA